MNAVTTNMPMNLKRVIAVASKESREILRDRLFFALVLVVPTVLMIVFGYGFSFDVENIPIAIVDHDGTALSREYAHRFIDSRYFDFKGYSHDVRELEPLLSDNKLRAVIVIPEHFQDRLLTPRPVAVQTLIDGTFPSRTNITKGYMTAINAAMSEELIASYGARKRGLPVEQVERKIQAVRLDIRFLYNESVKSDWSIAPASIMLVLLLAPPFYTALGIVREKESGSIYNIYASTVTRLEFLVGKLLPYVTISTFNSLILYALARWMFGAPFKGDPLFFFLVTVLYVICTTGMGLVISVLVRTQVSAMVIAGVTTMIPGILYSGLLFPIESLADASLVIAHLFPAKYYTDVIHGSFLKGVGIEVLWPEVLSLSFFAAILLTIGYLLFHKRPSS